MAFRQVAAEIDAEVEALRLDRVQRALDHLLELIVGAQQRARFHVLDRRNAGHRAMAARGRQQRHVVTRGLILVGIAEVVDAEVAPCGERLVTQVRVGAQDLGRRELEPPLLGVIDDDQRGHLSGALRLDHE